MVACWLVVFGAPNFHFLEFLVANWCLNAFEALHAVSQLRCIACSSTDPGSVVLSASQRDVSMRIEDLHRNTIRKILREVN